MRDFCTNISGAHLWKNACYANLVGALSTTRSGGTEAFRYAAHRKAFLATEESA